MHNSTHSKNCQRKLNVKHFKQMQMQWIIHDDEDKILETNKKKIQKWFNKKSCSILFQQLKTPKDLKIQSVLSNDIIRTLWYCLKLFNIGIIKWYLKVFYDNFFSKCFKFPVSVLFF